MATSETTRAVQRITGSIFLASVVATAAYVLILAIRLFTIAQESPTKGVVEVLWVKISLANAGSGFLPFPILVAFLGALFVGRAFIRKNRFGEVPLMVGICTGFLGFFVTLLLAVDAPDNERLGYIAQSGICQFDNCIETLNKGSGLTLKWLFCWFALSVLAMIEAKFDLIKYMRSIFG